LLKRDNEAIELGTYFKGRRKMGDSTNSYITKSFDEMTGKVFIKTKTFRLIEKKYDLRLNETLDFYPAIVITAEGEKHALMVFDSSFHDDGMTVISEISRIGLVSMEVERSEERDGKKVIFYSGEALGTTFLGWNWYLQSAISDAVRDCVSSWLKSKN